MRRCGTVMESRRQRALQVGSASFRDMTFISAQQLEHQERQGHEVPLDLQRGAHMDLQHFPRHYTPPSIPSLGREVTSQYPGVVVCSPETLQGQWVESQDTTMISRRPERVSAPGLGGLASRDLVESRVLEELQSRHDSRNIEERVWEHLHYVNCTGHRHVVPFIRIQTSSTWTPTAVGAPPHITASQVEASRNA
ncbi:uncharacterized protein LOC143040773 isoform X2 [Oratosquilla oratoria]|uniref:uncharacterized protein LOC143040773 isoform X2 n=1 Tax=Oratosquilla oratoria TaxID=337810 RepID=UPI003F75E8D5